MEIKKYEKEGFTIVELSGELTIECFVKVKDYVSEVIMRGKKEIIIDLSNVPYMDSSGLGALVAVMTTINRVEGKLFIVGLTERVKELLDVTHLTSFFKILPAIDDVFQFDWEEEERILGENHSDGGGL